ncbi:MAG: hypothetical protein WBE72_19470 [Terracidiphilus sp.]
MENANPLKTSTPVYAPYATLLSALDNLRTHGIPSTGIIDKSLWDTQSGAVQSQLLLALRFLGLIDEQNRVQPPLPILVRASAEERKTLLKPIIEQKYQSVISLGLATISQGQLEDAFRRFEISGSTLDRAIRFFVKACQECGIQISKRVSDKVRNSTTNPTRRRRNGGGRREVAEEQPGQFEETSSSSRIEDKLLAKFPEFDPSWPDPLKTKWFEGFERLMKSTLGEGTR